MADEQVAGAGAEASQLDEQVIGAEGLVTLPAEGADGVGADKSGDQVAVLKQEMANLKKSYDEIRPEFTRKSQEAATLRDQLSKTQGQVELLTSQQNRGVSPEIAAKEQEQFDKDWADKIDANPSAAIQYYRGVAGELQKNVTRSVSDVEQRLKSEIASVRELLEERDPFYAANKADVDKLIDVGLDRKTALKVVQTMKGTNGRAAQPGRPGAPGSVNSAGTGDTKVRGRPVAIDSVTLKLMKMNGLNEKDIQKIATDVGEEGAE